MSTVHSKTLKMRLWSVWHGNLKWFVKPIPSTEKLRKPIHIWSYHWNVYCLHDRLCCFVYTRVQVFPCPKWCFQCVFCMCAFVSLLHLAMTKHPLRAPDILHFLYSADLLCLFILMLQCNSFSSDRNSFWKFWNFFNLGWRMYSTCKVLTYRCFWKVCKILDTSIVMKSNWKRKYWKRLL